MEILVLGGTGAMGIHLVKLLSAQNVNCVVTTRKNRASSNCITYVQGDAHDTEFLKSVLAEKHWKTIVDFMMYSGEVFKQHVDLLLNSTEQYVFLSSARVYADSEIPITEKSERLLDASSDLNFLQTNDYPLTKARQEDILYNSGRKNWTIIRPYITFSETRLQLGVLEKENWLYRSLHGRTIVFSKDISEKLTTLTYGLDVATGILKIIGNTKAFGEVFHITAKEAHCWREILSIYLDVIEKKRSFRPKVQMVEKAVGVHKYAISYDRMYNRIFDNSKIKQLIEVDNFIETKAGLIKCLEEFLCNPQFNDISWYQEAVNDKLTGERTPLREISSLKQKMKYLLYRYIILF